MIYRLECKVVFWFLIIVIFFFGCFYFLVFRKGKIDFGEYFVMSFIFNILQSVVKLDDKEMMVEKNCLVDLKLVMLFGVGKFLDLQSFISFDELI